MLKDSVLHIPVFLIVFAVTFTVLLAFSLLAAWTAVYNPAFELEAGWFTLQLKAQAGGVLLATMFFSLFILFFRVRKKPGSKILTLLLILAAAFLIMLVGATVIYGPPGSPLPRKYGTLHPFIPETVHEADGLLVYTGDVAGSRQGTEGLRLTNTVLYGAGEFRYYPESTVAVRSLEGAAVIIPSDDSQEPISVTPANPVYNPTFNPPDAISSLWNDIAALNRYFLEKRASSPELYTVSLLSVMFFAVSCMRFLLASRWPLVGALLTLAAFRGVFLLIRFYDSEIGLEIRNMLPQGTVQEMAFTFMMLILGGLLTAMMFVFPGKQHG